MINDNYYRVKELKGEQNEEYIETVILSVLKEQKLSLSQARGVLNRVLARIEDENIINL